MKKEKTALSHFVTLNLLALMAFSAHAQTQELRIPGVDPQEHSQNKTIPNSGIINVTVALDEGATNTGHGTGDSIQIVVKDCGPDAKCVLKKVLTFTQEKYLNTGNSEVVIKLVNAGLKYVLDSKMSDTAQVDLSKLNADSLELLSLSGDQRVAILFDELTFLTQTKELTNELRLKNFLKIMCRQGNGSITLPRYSYRTYFTLLGNIAYQMTIDQPADQKRSELYKQTLAGFGDYGAFELNGILQKTLKLSKDILGE